MPPDRSPPTPGGPAAGPAAGGRPAAVDGLRGGVPVCPADTPDPLRRRRDGAGRPGAAVVWLSVWLAAALGLLAGGAAGPAPLAAQADETVDQGSFELRVDGRTVGTETFEIRRSGRQFRAAGRILLDSTVAGLRPLEVVLETDAERVPQLLRLRPTAGDLRSVTAVREDGRLRVQVSSEAGDRWKEFVASPDVALVEPGIAHHWGLILDRHRDRLADSPVVEVSAVVPSEARRTTVRIRREGPDRVDVPGANRDGVRFTASVGGEREILIWTSEEGRVLRVESPARKTIAVRHPDR